MADLKTVILVSEDLKLREFLLPMSQWLDFHAPAKNIEALEAIKVHHPDLFLVDAESLTPMVMALLTEILRLPQYKKAPLIIIGDSRNAKRLQADAHFDKKLTLRRLEMKIADLLKIKLVGRGSHGPHSGSLY